VLKTERKTVRKWNEKRREKDRIDAKTGDT
jgi:hypothetical protein